MEQSLFDLKNFPDFHKISMERLKKRIQASKAKYTRSIELSFGHTEEQNINAAQTKLGLDSKEFYERAILNYAKQILMS